ncbi:MAG: 2-hydroxy-3-oxopropionate reductase [Lautropia sp. SCN 69-89]|nr:MAG: 2-hydroxy-3-oxopropionate reductase [Lautropia sp. SCN 69-89]
MTQTKRIGMVGVGLMGHGIASSLLRHGLPLTFLDHPGNRPTADLLSAGARAAMSGAAVAAASDVVILCVTGSPEVEDALFRDDGVLAGLRQGAVVIDCSTAMPSSTARIAAALEAAGARFLDAPMTRTPKEAAQGRLNLIVGGDPALFAECRPLLACFAENIVHAGPVGSGHALKLLHNYVSLGFAAVLAEALACARRAGIDSEVLLQVLAKGGGGGVVLERLRPFIETRDDSGFRFTIANAQKDMGYYAGMAGELGAVRITAEAVRETYARAAEGHARSTVPTLIDLLAS